MRVMRAANSPSPSPCKGEGGETRGSGEPGEGHIRPRALSPPLRGDPLPQAGEGKRARERNRPSEQPFFLTPAPLYYPCRPARAGYGDKRAS